MEIIKERLTRLRERMKEHRVGVYVIPSSDCHESEYVCAHYRAREYLSGFTGSAGTLVVTMEEAGLWTDGRYFLQAERQLKGTGIRLFRSGEPEVPKIEEYAEQKLSRDSVLGFDGRTMGAHRAETLIRAAEKKGAGVLVTEDLAGQVWENRPEIPDTELYVLDLCYAGEDTKSRLARVRAEMEKIKADAGRSVRYRMASEHPGRRHPLRAGGAVLFVRHEGRLHLVCTGADHDGRDPAVSERAGRPGPGLRGGL